MKLVIGLIGGIGSGKSLVGRFFAESGAHVIEGDKLGHEGLEQPDIRGQVTARWGNEILKTTGEVDRRKLGASVFADEKERRALEAMVFPFIGQRIQEEIAKAQADLNIKLIVLDAAVMLEAGWNRFCNYVIFVDASRAQRLARLAAQRGWTAKDLEARETAQLPLEEKKARANAVIDNSGDPQNTRRQVEEWIQRIL